MLLHSLGPEGLRVYNQMQKPERPGDLDIFKTALLDLSEHYSPTVCIGVTRRAFFKRKQFQHESVDEYVSSLKTLAAKCKFGPLHDEFIRDQIVVCTKNKGIQDRLWIEGESSLRDVIALVKKKKAELSDRSS